MSRTRAVAAAVALALLVAATAAALVWMLREPEAPGDAAPAAARKSRASGVRKPRRVHADEGAAEDPELGIRTAWDAAVAAHKAGRPVEALQGLVPWRRDRPAWFEDPARAKLLAEMEQAALASLSRAVRSASGADAKNLAATVRDLLTDPRLLAQAADLAAAADRRIAAGKPGVGGDIVERAGLLSDKQAISRHLQRFAGSGAAGKPKDWIDSQLAAVDAANQALKKEPEPLPVADAAAAEQRRLDELEKLRQRDMAGLLDHIDGALAWLALHQADDGHFGADATAARCIALKHDPACVAAGTKEQYPLAATGLAVLALLDFRDQDVKRLFEPTLARGIAWLLAQQQKDGSFSGSGRSGYSAAIGLMALGQAAASARTKELKDSVERGLAWYAKHPGRNYRGYRYGLDQEGDLSVTGWYVQAYEAATLAGAKLPESLRRDLDYYLAYVWLGDHRFVYTVGAAERASLSPVGMLSMSILRPDSPRQFGDEWRAYLSPGAPAANVYTLYYGVRLLLALDGKLPDKWRRYLNDLAGSQTVKGFGAGMFPLPNDPWFGARGPTIATAFATLTLEHSLYRR